MRLADQMRSLQEATGEIERVTLALRLQMDPMVSAVHAAERHYAQQIAPMLSALDEFQRMTQIDEVRESIRQMTEGYLSMQEQLFEPTQLMIDEFRAAMAFPALSKIAEQAALLRYPWLDMDPIHWPEDFDIGEPPEPDDSKSPSSVRKHWRDALLVTSFLWQFAGNGIEINTQKTTIINIKTPAPARVAPSGRAPELERLPTGTKILTLDGEDRWCPVWPVGEFQGGWVFHRHIEGVE